MQAAFFDLDKTAAPTAAVGGVVVAVGLGLAGWRWLRQRPAA